MTAVRVAAPDTCVTISRCDTAFTGRECSLTFVDAATRGTMHELVLGHLSDVVGMSVGAFSTCLMGVVLLGSRANLLVGTGTKRRCLPPYPEAPSRTLFVAP